MSGLSNKEVLAENLNRLMILHDKDRRQMCRDLEVSYSTFSDWANGVKYPRIDKIERIANYFGVPKSELIEPARPTNAISVTGVIPIYGSIPAGLPAFADEYIEGHVATTISSPENHFALRVKGDSMIGAGIPDGSVVVLRKQDFANDGDIVACGVNDDEATLKRIKIADSTVVLLPENTAYSPIIISKDDFDSGKARIYGVAVEVTRKL